eukprot:SAG11_NODE_1661_length_4497_cov_5.237608_6_plen_153_part_00
MQGLYAARVAELAHLEGVPSNRCVCMQRSAPRKRILRSGSALVSFLLLHTAPAAPVDGGLRFFGLMEAELLRVGYCGCERIVLRRFQCWDVAECSHRASHGSFEAAAAASLRSVPFTAVQYEAFSGRRGRRGARSRGHGMHKFSTRVPGYRK